MIGWKQETTIWRDDTDSLAPLTTLDILLTPPPGATIVIDDRAWTVTTLPQVTVLPADPPYRAGYEVSALLHVKAAS